MPRQLIQVVCRIATFVLFLSLPPAVGNAQNVATNFDELRFRIATGDTIYITDPNGRETRAKVVELSSSVLTVRISGEPLELAKEDVRRIRQRLPDPLWAGALIGGGIGVGLGAGVASISESCSSKGGAECVAPALSYAAIGAGIGIGIDALIKGRKVIYEASGGKTVRWLLSPIVSGTTKAARMSVLF